MLPINGDISIRTDAQHSQVDEKSLNEVEYERVSRSSQQNVQPTEECPRISRSSDISTHNISEDYLQYITNCDSSTTRICVEPPPYAALPIYSIPLSQGLPPSYRPRSLHDPPPPYDPSMRSPFTADPPEEIIVDDNPTTDDGCKPDTLISLGFCFCSVDQLIVIIALFGTFFFLCIGLR
ncbi:hypothetical protein HHI36_014548 [Cryptolaemus montrouzieri]